MPVEIRELQITTTISDSPAGAAPANSVATSSGINTNEIVATCVEQVLEILKQKNER